MSSSPAAAYIYWTEYPSSDSTYSFTGIGRVNLDGSGVVENFIPTLAPDAAIATAGRYLYWTNPRSGTIGRADVLGGSINQRFITVKGTNVSVIALAVGGGHIYWSWYSENGTDPTTIVARIGRANIDGSGVEQNFILVGTGGNSMVGAVALGGPYLFWVQGYGATQVTRAKLDGHGATEFVGNSGRMLGLPNKIACNGGFLYFNSDGAIGKSASMAVVPNSSVSCG